MRVAISGATGLIGSALARTLEARGDTVVPIARGAASGDQIAWDPGANTIDAEALECVDVLVHLAGASIADGRWSPERKALIRDSRIEGTRLLARTLGARARGPKTWINGSAIGYYGERGDATMIEQSDPGEGFLSELVQDWEAEAEGQAQLVSLGVRVASLRTAMVLSINGGALAKMLPLFRAGLGGRIGSGRQYWSWISIDDMVGGILHLIDTPLLSGPFNFCAPHAVTNLEFTKSLGRALNRPAILPVPSFGPKLLLGSELAKNLLLTSTRVEPKALSDAGYEFVHPRLDVALRALLARD